MEYPPLPFVASIISGGLNISYTYEHDIAIVSILRRPRQYSFFLAHILILVIYFTSISGIMIILSTILICAASFYFLFA